MQHIPYVDGKPLIGTAHYASINTHFGIQQSRRDDLESIAYLLIYFLKGSLPWIGLKADNPHTKNSMVRDAKVSTPIDSLCKGLPAEFSAFLSEVRRLEFSQEPPYSLYRDLFRQLFMKERYVHDMQFDWINRPAPFAQSLSLSDLASRPLAMLAGENDPAASNLPRMKQPRKDVAHPGRLGAPAMKTSQRAFKH
jgi:serine/threonine protein kinase